MEVLECIKARRSIRKYRSDNIPWDHISNILDAGRLAPSSGNLQSWKFIVIKDEAKKKQLADACVQQFWMESAPIHIVVVGDPDKVKRFYGDRGERLYVIQNCAAAVENMLLEATNLGLGSCWIGAFDEDMVRRALDIPPEIRPQAIITIGYSDETPQDQVRLPIEATIYLDKWRRKIRNVPAYFYYWSPGIQKNIQKGKSVVEEGGKSLMQKAREVAKNIRSKLEKKNKEQEEEINQIKRE